MIKIIDNFLPVKKQVEFCNTICSSEIPWYWQENSNYNSVSDIERNSNLPFLENHYDYPQFTHQVFDGYNIKSEYFPYVEEIFIKRIMETLGQSITLIRFKFNLSLPFKPFPKNANGSPHVDYIGLQENNIDNLKTAVYYVNDSDGDTLLYKETFCENKKYDVVNLDQSVSPKMGRMVIFDGNIIHAAQLPSEHKRVVANINFVIK